MSQMNTWTPGTPAEPDDLDAMLAEVRQDPEARSAFEDARERDNLLMEMVRCRGRVSQAEISRLMRTTQSAVSDLENGRVDPRLSTLQRYARAVHSRLRLELEPELVHDDVVMEKVIELGADVTLAKLMTSLVRREPEAGPQSPAELAGAVDLPDALVAYTVSQLHHKGWLTAVQPDRAQAPRYQLRDDRGLVIGVSLHRDFAAAVLANLRATHVVARLTTPLPSRTPTAVTETVLRIVDQLRDKALAGHDVVGLGVSLAGLIEGSTGEVIFAPDLHSEEYPWRNVGLEATLQERSGLRTAVENNANALAMHEYLLHGEVEDGLAVVLINSTGEGVGGGLVINDKLAHGFGGLGGELGHVVVEPNGLPCRCAPGARGCLETLASPAAIVRYAAEHGAGRPSSLRDVARLAGRGDVAGSTAFHRAGAALAKVMADVVTIVGPRRIVLFGPAELVDVTKASARLFVEEIRGRSETFAFGAKVDLVTKTLTDSTQPTAAAAAAVRYFLSRPRRWVPGITDPIPSGRLVPPGAPGYRRFQR